MNATGAPALASELGYLKGQIDVLKSRPRETKTLAADERAKTLGSLGSGDKGGAEYRKWTSTILQMVEEHFSTNGKAMLQAAKAAGDTRLTDGTCELGVPDEVVAASNVDDSSAAPQLDRELYSLLMQQSAGNVWQALDNLRDMPWPGFNSWRVVHYGATPRTP